MLTILQFVLTTLLSYAGLYVGVLLGINSPEELTPGKKYFNFAKNFLFVIIILTIVYLLREQWPSLVLLLITYAFFRVVHKRWFFTLQEFYVVCAVILLIASKSSSAFFIIACEVFIYGLLVGPLIVEPHTKHKKLLKTKRQLFSKALNLTINFIGVFLLVAIIFLIGTLKIHIK